MISPTPWVVGISPDKSDRWPCYRLRDMTNPIDPKEQEDNRLLIEIAPKLLAALQKIAEGKGRYSRDHLTHAENTIEDIKEIALRALAQAPECPRVDDDEEGSDDRQREA